MPFCFCAGGLELADAQTTPLFNSALMTEQQDRCSPSPGTLLQAPSSRVSVCLSKNRDIDSSAIRFPLGPRLFPSHQKHKVAESNHGPLSVFQKR